MEEQKTNEQALNQQEPSDALAEAQALTEMSSKVRNLEAENAELKAAKKKYYDAVLNGNTLEDNGPKERTVKEIRKDLFGRDNKDDMTNLEYATLAVELDDACIRETGESCFIPKGKNVEVSYDETITATKMKKALQDSIEAADGDPNAFNREFAKFIKRK